MNLDLEFKSVRALQDLVVAWRGGGAIRLADVARVIDGEGDLRSLTRFNGKPAVLVALCGGQQQYRGAQPAVIERVDGQIRPALPPRHRADLGGQRRQLCGGDDRRAERPFIRRHAAGRADCLAVFAQLALDLIISLAIPVSLLGAVAVMYFLGYTFNTVTLWGFCC